MNQLIYIVFEDGRRLCKNRVACDSIGLEKRDACTNEVLSLFPFQCEATSKLKPTIRVEVEKPLFR
jgi:hypothetical protein